jgi:hypothetical protein
LSARAGLALLEHFQVYDLGVELLENPVDSLEHPVQVTGWSREVIGFPVFQRKKHRNGIQEVAGSIPAGSTPYLSIV